MDECLGFVFSRPSLATVRLAKAGTYRFISSPLLSFPLHFFFPAELPHAAASINLCVAMVELNHLRASATSQGTQARIECRRVWEALNAAEQTCYRAPDDSSRVSVDATNRTAVSRTT